MFGVAMLALAVAYGLAAAQPQRSRSMLVTLFVFPLGLAVVAFANVARGDVAYNVRSVAFAVYNLAYCLLYFRVYPRVVLSDARPAPDGPKT